MFEEEILMIRNLLNGGSDDDLYHIVWREQSNENDYVSYLEEEIEKRKSKSNETNLNENNTSQ